MAVIDGSHRMEAAMQMGEQTLDALVYIDLTIEEEAKLYRQFGDYLGQTALDKFHAGLTEGIQQYRDIDAIVVRQGLHIPNQLGSINGSIDAVDALIKISTMYGNDMLSRTLELTHDAWGDEHRAYRHMILSGTAAFLIRFHTHPNFSRKRLLQRMKRLGMGHIERLALSIKEGSLASNTGAAWGQALLAIHDQRIQEGNDLGEWVKRHVTEKTKQASRDSLNKLRAAETKEQRTARAQKAADTRFGFTARNTTCPYCHAGPNQRCTNSKGQPTHNYHKDRLIAARPKP
jgi:hypothetical protein